MPRGAQVAFALNLRAERAVALEEIAACTGPVDQLHRLQGRAQMLDELSQRIESTAKHAPDPTDPRARPAPPPGAMAEIA